MHDMQIQAGAPLITSPDTNDTTTARPTPQRLLYLAVVIVAVPVYVADQLSKAWAVANLQPDQPRELIGSVLQLNLTRNPGAAFSIATGATWILTAIACFVVVFVVITARRLGSRGWALALGLLLAGSLGNLTDRMFRAPGPGRGQVVDFVQLPHYPIFNVADSAIVSAAVLIALMAFRGVGIDGTRAPGDKRGHDKPGHDKPPNDKPGHDLPRNDSPISDNRQADSPAGDNRQADSPAGDNRQADSQDESARVRPPQQQTGTDHDV
jgi:signal peptidase II